MKKPCCLRQSVGAGPSRTSTKNGGSPSLTGFVLAMSALQWLACRGRVSTAASSLPLGRRAAWVLSVRPRGLTAQQALPQDGVERGAAAVATVAVATRAEWGPDSRRCGALAVKVGMMSLFDGYGARVGVTVLTLDDLQVVQVKSPPKDDVLALQVGMGSKRRHSLAKAARNHFEAAGIEPKYKLAEFSVTPDCLMPVGTVISARHFVPGQYVDIKVCLPPSAPPLPARGAPAHELLAACSS